MKLIIKCTSWICATWALVLLVTLTWVRPNPAIGADKAIVVNFPKPPVGRYGIIKPAPNPDDDVILRSNEWATGAVKVPAGCFLSLSINFYGSQNTKFMSTLPSGIVRNLSCRDLEVGDKAVADLCTQKDLVLLNLQGIDLTDEGVKHLSVLKKLRKLSICDTLVTAKGLSVLRNLPQLENLNLARLTLGEAVDAPLQSLKNLTVLELTGTQLTDKAVIDLPYLPKLQTLVLRRNNLTDKCIESLYKYKTLQNLDFTDTHVTGEGLKRLKGLPNLHRITIRTKVLKLADRAQLKKLMPRLKIEEGSRESIVPTEIFAPLH
ncbi:MAG TPA: hypothetical protein EYN91_16430 [Candidatus Melainabacteria bacterium]|jgi:hypothetical protein|nr:hypothetical protein [Candidatus Melainabacteria bacterium]